MANRTRAWAPVLMISIVSLFGCDVFDRDIVEALRPPDAGGMGDTGPEDAGPIPFGETCNDIEALPLVSELGASFVLDTSGMNNDFSQLGGCLATSADGPDAFLAVDAREGQAWHIHVVPQNRVNDDEPPQNIVLYAMSSCDARRCAPGYGLDLCGDSQEEHFTFITTTTGRWIVGFDDANPEGGRYGIQVLTPVCRDGVLDHNEVCEPSIDPDCTMDCRKVLSEIRRREIDPNDDITTANWLELDMDGELVVQGSIGGFCDTDLFALAVDDDSTLQVELREPDAVAACTGNALPEVPAGQRPIRLAILDTDGVTEIEGGEASDEDGCPSLMAEGLAAGLYFLRVDGGEDLEAFGYDLFVKVQQ